MADVADVVAAVAGAFFDARADLLTLERTIEEQVSRVLQARCTLCGAVEPEISSRRMVVPLRRANRAVIVTRDDNREPFDDDDHQLLALVADHAGIALANAIAIREVIDRTAEEIGASNVAHDITERRAAERALAAAKDAAETANRELETFSHSVAHDLRAPLRGIDAFARFVLEDCGDKLDADGRDHVAKIRTNAKKMSELIDGLLSLARVSRAELRCEPTDLSMLARSAAAQLASVDPDRHVEVVIATPLRADCDPGLTRTLIANLVGNAWKFTSNAPQPRIEVGATDDSHVFFVRDNGAGFDMDRAKQLFAPFQRMHPVHEFPGTGVGLATVQRIVHRHGGRIWAEAEVNRGATFYFTLPARTST